MNTRTQVLAVDQRQRHYGVVKRNVMPYEPAFVVVEEGSGRPANSIAHFFNQEDAEDYARHRNRLVHTCTR